MSFPSAAFSTANPTLAIKAGFSVPEAPLWACFHQPLPHCSFHASCLCLSVRPSPFDLERQVKPSIIFCPLAFRMPQESYSSPLQRMPPNQFPGTSSKAAIHPAGEPFLVKGTYTAVHEKIKPLSSLSHLSQRRLTEENLWKARTSFMLTLWKESKQVLNIHFHY